MQTPGFLRKPCRQRYFLSPNDTDCGEASPIKCLCSPWRHSSACALLQAGSVPQLSPAGCLQPQALPREDATGVWGSYAGSRTCTSSHPCRKLNCFAQRLRCVRFLLSPSSPESFSPKEKNTLVSFCSLFKIREKKLIYKSN